MARTILTILVFVVALFYFVPQTWWFLGSVLGLYVWPGW